MGSSVFNPEMNKMWPNLNLSCLHKYNLRKLFQNMLLPPPKAQNEIANYPHPQPGLQSASLVLVDI